MKEIQTNGITILLVEVPEDAREFKIENGLLLFKADFIPFGIVILPQGQYQILGKSTELSEEQMKGICWQVSFGNYTGYKNYNQAKCSDFRDIVESSFSTVQESYLSLLEANGIVDRNMIDKPNEADILEEHEDWIYSRAKYKSLLEQWQESQSKVKHYLVLKRI